MISFFTSNHQSTYTIEHETAFSDEELGRIKWLLSGATYLDKPTIKNRFIGPRKEMVSPWSTNAVEIFKISGIESVKRIEEFISEDHFEGHFDPMLQKRYDELNEHIFIINHSPESIQYIENITEYNLAEGLALSPEEIGYLNTVSEQLGRPLTDSEVFGFSQVNSEHCRHKIFNGKFIIDGVEKPSTLFQLVKATSKANPNYIVSAYKDNVAFVKGPVVEQFSPEDQSQGSYFETKEIESLISLKAETHNFPTTVEPFYGASTGSGGEIRDRMAGGTAAIPIAGTAVYMTSYPRIGKDRDWVNQFAEREWLYQTPTEILIKASNGASDFGNKFGQPLICGSLLTFEHSGPLKHYGFDKVIMLAGGIGYAKQEHAQKNKPRKGDLIVVMGGDNYRIGMGGGAVSSVDTGNFSKNLELNAVQRANPEMQKRVSNVIRAFSEHANNPIISIHDHGAGGHLNCLSELVEEVGGTIYLNKLPIGDQTLSYKEIAGNESQERMGLVIAESDLELLKRISERERAPMYVVGEVTNDMYFKFTDEKTGDSPIDWELSHMFGSSPQVELRDQVVQENFEDISYEPAHFKENLEKVLRLEAVACKDWLTNKVDRCVTGKVALQQSCGSIQLPLNNVAITTIDFSSNSGIATSIGHAPVASIINPEAGSRLAITKALTNLVWAPLADGIRSVSLSANWMWPAKNSGENDRLYRAVEAVAQFAIDLGINIPTGKDSLSMKQKYPDGTEVYSPGTVIISATAQAKEVRKAVSPNLKKDYESKLIYINLADSNFHLGGSSFGQVLGQLGSSVPEPLEANQIKTVFDEIQNAISEGEILAGHDVSSGGLIVSLLEMCFPEDEIGLQINLNSCSDTPLTQIVFSENPGLLIQASSKKFIDRLENQNIDFAEIGQIIKGRKFEILHNQEKIDLDIDELRDIWFETSFLLDSEQTKSELAKKRYENYKSQPLNFRFPKQHTGKLEDLGLSRKRKPSGVKAAIIREKGVNSDREMAYALYLAGFDVKDIHMTDLIAGREDLSDVNMIVFVGGFSNSDVLGSAKGWAGAFLYNEKAKMALDNFYAREDTLSLGVCNGCQLMMELELINTGDSEHPKMRHNESGKFECSFLTIDIPDNESVMLKSLSGSRLGIWMAHGEGKFDVPKEESHYAISAKYSYSAYPGNPNGSDYDFAAIHSENGRHLAIMPHLERSLFSWNWANYPEERKSDEVSPWIIPFVEARKWIEKA
ncbi:MAG: phosphoribosylformylglycinamidine synthase [Bacteroidota bacterium]